MRYSMLSVSTSSAPMRIMTGFARIATITDEIMASIKPRMRELAASESAASCSLLPRRNAMEVVAPTPIPSPAHIISP